MPCRDHYSEKFDRQAEIQRTAAQEARVDYFAGMLCSLCEVTPIDILMTLPKVNTWWTAHQEADRKAEAIRAKRRKAKEDKDKAIMSGLKKLSEEERLALGI